MAYSVTAFDAKTHLSKLLDRAKRGEEILITKRGVPTAKLVPIRDAQNFETTQKTVEKLRKLAKNISIPASSFEELLQYKNIGRK